MGNYNDQYNVGQVIIKRDGNQLLIEMPLLEQAGSIVTPELEAVSSDIFYVYIDDKPKELTFIRSEPDGLSTYIRNRSFVATRVEDEPDAGTAKAGATPSREDVERWINRTRLEPHPVALDLRR